MNYDWFKAINDLSGNSALDSIMKFSAKYLIFAVFAVAAVLCLLRLRAGLRRPVVLTVAALVLTFAAGLVEAAVHSENRPFQSHRVHQLISHAGGQSFPSDHATAAFGVALAVTVFLNRWWGALLFVVAVLIGFARVYAGIHYPSDIGGSLLAAAIGVGLVALADRFLSGRSAQRSPLPAS